MNRILLASTLMLVALAPQAQQIAMKTENGVQWACGGVGVEERRAISALAAQASLFLLLVTEKRGGYLADVEVRLFDRNASTPRLTINAEGPMCLFRVPAGHYRIEGTYRGAARRTEADVPAGVAPPLRKVFAFRGEPWDGIWASDEEKRQARE